MRQLEDIATLKADNAALSARIAELEARLPPPPPATSPALGGQPYVERSVTIGTLPPSRGEFEMPNDDELRKLAERVLDAHEFLRKEAAESNRFLRDFAVAFRAVGYLKRTEAPDAKLSFSAHIDAASDVLNELGVVGRHVDGTALLSAILAHGDIVWRRHDKFLGQPLEVGLAKWGGRPCSNRWRDVLRSAPLLAPLPSRFAQLPADRAPRPIIWRQDATTGELEQITGNEVWSR